MLITKRKIKIDITGSRFYVDGNLLKNSEFGEDIIPEGKWDQTVAILGKSFKLPKLNNNEMSK